jgi:hypothetical protein
MILCGDGAFNPEPAATVRYAVAAGSGLNEGYCISF